MRDRKDELMDRIEELSEMEIAEMDQQEQLADSITSDDVRHINEMPLLYRMQLKRLLDRHHNPVADQIDT